MNAERRSHNPAERDRSSVAAHEEGMARRESPPTYSRRTRGWRGEIGVIWLGARDGALGSTAESGKGI